jgi:hypothetical protein
MPRRPRASGWRRPCGHRRSTWTRPSGRRTASDNSIPRRRLSYRRPAPTAYRSPELVMAAYGRRQTGLRRSREARSAATPLCRSGTAWRGPGRPEARRNQRSSDRTGPGETADR